MKKLLITLLTISLALSTFVFTACGKDKGDSSDAPVISEIPEVEPSIELNTQVLPLVIGDYAQIKATTNNLKGWSVYYTVGDTSIATIDEAGNIEALNEGKTKVIATYTNGKKSKRAECELNVGYGGMVPEFDFVQNIDLNKTLNIATNSEFVITPLVKFNGRKYYDAKFAFEVLTNDSSILSYDASKGMLKSGSTSGEVLVTVKTISWKGRDYSANNTMKKTIKVKVVDTSYMTVNGDAISDITLHTQKEFNGVSYQTEMPFVAQVNYNGNIVSSKNIDISIANEAVVKYDATTQTIRAVGYGETVVTLTYVHESGNTIIQSLVVSVYRPTMVVSEIVDNFVTTRGEYLKADGTYSTIADFIDGDVNFVMGTENGKALTFAQNKVFGVQAISSTENLTTIIVGNEKILYEFTLRVYKHILTEPEDLYLLQMDEDYEGDGYWLFANDIDATGIVLNHSKFSTANGFTGILDGDGHTIFNLNVSDITRTIGTSVTKGYGLFGYLGNGAKVLNLGFVNMNATKAYYFSHHGGSGSSFGSNITVRNCYFGISSDTKYPRGFAHKFDSSIIFENIVIEYDGKLEDENSTGDYSKYLNFNGAEAGGPVGLFVGDLAGASDKSNNIYVLSEYPICFNTASANQKTNKNNPINYVRAWRWAENDTVLPGRLFYDSGDRVPKQIPTNRVNSIWNASSAGCNGQLLGQENFVDYKGALYVYSTEDIDPDTGLLLPDATAEDLDENGNLKEELIGVKALREPIVATYDGYNKVTTSSCNHATFNYVRRYDNAQVLSDNKNINKSGKFNVNKFDSEFWQIVDGVPKFKTADTVTYPIVNGAKITNNYNVATVGNVHTVDVETSIGVSLKVLNIESSNTEYIETIAGTNKVRLVKAAEDNQDVNVELTVTYNRNGVICEMTVVFTVTSDLKEISSELEWSTLDGKFTYSELGLSSEDEVQTITSAIQIVKNAKDPNKEDEVKLEVVNGLITNTRIAVQDNMKDVDPIKLKVFYGEKAYYFTNLKAYTKVIKSGEDMKVLALSKDVVLDGYYVLASNIDMTGIVIQHVDINDGDSTEGFGGVFNGKGYVISNFDATQNNHYVSSTSAKSKVGIFGKINGGTILNVAFKDLKATQANYFANYSFANFNISNIYIRLSADTNLPKGLWGQLYGVSGKKALVDHMIIEYTTGKEFENYTGTFMDGYPNATVGVFCSSPAGGVSTGSRNIYVISPYYIYSGGDPNQLSCIQMDRYAENEPYVRAKIYKEDGEPVKVTEANMIWNTGLKENETPLRVYLKAENGALEIVNTELTPSVNIGRFLSVRRYDSIEAMSADEANNQGSTYEFRLNLFDTTYWTVTDGVPRWNNF